MIIRYPSIAALTEAARKGGRLCGIAGKRGLHPSDERRDWCGGESIAQTLRYGRLGNDKLVPEAEKLIERFSDQIDVPLLSWQSDVTGAYPVVPEFLAGMPDCMRRRQRSESERAPLNIYVTITASYDITAAHMMRRGTAILAFVLAMSRVRPITLSVINIASGNQDGETIIVAPINTTPLDIASAAWTLSSAGFFRRLCLGLCGDLNGDTGTWPRKFNHSDQQPYLRDLTVRLGGDPDQDMMIGPSHLYDPLISNPIVWLQDQITRYVAQE